MASQDFITPLSNNPSHDIQLSDGNPELNGDDGSLNEGDYGGDDDDDDGGIYYMPWEDIAPKIQALCRMVWPTADHDRTKVSFLAEGSYNKVIDVSINQRGVLQEYVIRIPCDESTILSSVAILRYLRHKTNLKAPGVVCYDNTKNNPLEYGYIVLEKISGVPLSQCWDGLTQHQKKTLAKEIGQFHVKLRSIKNPTAGCLKVPSEETESFIDDPESRLTVEPYGACTDDFEWEINYEDSSGKVIPLDRLREDPPNLPCDDMMLAPFKRRLYHFTHRDRPAGHKGEAFQFLLEMIQGMVKRGLFANSENSGFCLWHPDLWPRNIMVDLNADPIISGILDWDAPVFAPPFVAATPPWWLWKREEEEQSVDSDVPVYENPEMEPISREALDADTPENAEIKRVFEAVVGQGWIRQAYQPEYVYARRALALAELAIWSDTHTLAFFEMKETWFQHIQQASSEPVSIVKPSNGFHSETPIQEKCSHDQPLQHVNAGEIHGLQNSAVTTLPQRNFPQVQRKTQEMRETLYHFSIIFLGSLLGFTLACAVFLRLLPYPVYTGQTSCEVAYLNPLIFSTTVRSSTSTHYDVVITFVKNHMEFN